VPLATIQRWLGHHNISQTFTYLVALHGGDADMRAFEQRIGRPDPPFAIR
jgi:integrase